MKPLRNQEPPVPWAVVVENVFSQAGSFPSLAADRDDDDDVLTFWLRTPATARPHHPRLQEGW